MLSIRFEVHAVVTWAVVLRYRERYNTYSPAHCSSLCDTAFQKSLIIRGFFREAEVTVTGTLLRNTKENGRTIAGEPMEISSPDGL